MSTTTPDVSKRWTAFQCPACFGLFRIQRFNLGRDGACPGCQTIVSIPDDGKAGSGGEPVRRASDPGLLEKVAVATPMTEEELAAAAAKEAAGRERRRAYAGGGKDILDWEEGAKKGGSGKRNTGYFIGVAAMVVVLAGAGGVYYVQNAPKGKVTPGGLVVGDASSNRALEEALKSTEAKEEIDAEVLETVDDYDKFDLQRIEESVEAFLNTRTIEERLKHVRDPERVKPLMQNYYGKEEIEPERFKSLYREKVSVSGRLVTVPVQTGDFLSYLIDVYRDGDGDAAAYLIDWESWVGYCEITPAKARVEKPTEPFLMRVNLRPDNYYNFGFSDDSKWSGFRMTFRSSDEVFLAYSARGSAPDKILNEDLRKGGDKPGSYVVKVRYPAGARASDQVEIVEVLGEGWILNSESK